MADKGVIFSAPMVRTLLAGRKAQTRRLLKTQIDENRLSKPFRPEPREGRRWVWMCRVDFPEYSFAADDFTVPYASGDRLYVREAFSYADLPQCVWYWADGDSGEIECAKREPSIHMPRWASRLWLAVAEVRVQRLQDISEADAKAEGVLPEFEIDIANFVRGSFDPVKSSTHRLGYKHLWNQLHEKPGTRWEDNPWVCAVTFDVHHGNIDEGSQ